MKHLEPLFIFFISVNSVFAQSQWIPAIYTDSSGNKLPYRILYPEKYDSLKAYPFVLFLHGRGERGNDNLSQLKHGSDLFFKNKNRKRFPAIIVFPQCPEDSYWASADIDRSVKPFNIIFDNHRESNWPLSASVELVRKFINSGKADSERIYIMGMSMGGMGTLEALAKKPELFTAAVPICGGGDTSFTGMYAGKVPLWLFHGDNDSSVSVLHSRNIVTAVKRSRESVKYTEYKKTGHNCWEKVWDEKKLLPWLFNQKKGKG
jgi:predicted peptidase